MMQLRSDFSRREFLQATAAISVAGGLLAKSARSAEDDLIVRTPDPYNAEPALAKLVAERITPVKHFYVRNHGPTPWIDANTAKARLEGLINERFELPLAEFVSEVKTRYQQHTIEATLTCAGNRRKELSDIKEVGGVQWAAGAIGHARWTGARLSDILKARGVQSGAKHVWFEGFDPIKEKDGSVAPFGGSISLDKVMAENGSPLVVHTMNDQPLTPEHGAPLRVIVPGYIGARSVKWLSKITVSDRPSPNHYVAEAYKIIKSEEKAELAAAEPIYSFGVNAAICTPTPEQRLKAGKTTVRGYALPGGEPGCTIERVEVSSNNGQSWTVGVIDAQKRPFTWSLWSAELNLSPGNHELAVRATDSRGRTMPNQGEWNLKGYMYNGWHRVNVEVA